MSLADNIRYSKYCNTNSFCGIVTFFFLFGNDSSFSSGPYVPFQPTCNQELGQWFNRQKKNDNKLIYIYRSKYEVIVDVLFKAGIEINSFFRLFFLFLNSVDVSFKKISVPVESLWKEILPLKTFYRVFSCNRYSRIYRVKVSWKQVILERVLKKILKIPNH